VTEGEEFEFLLLFHKSKRKEAKEVLQLEEKPLATPELDQGKFDRRVTGDAHAAAAIQDPRGSVSKSGACSRCGEEGHISRECPKNTSGG
jgi:hypothetical protein